MHTLFNVALDFVDLCWALSTTTNRGNKLDKSNAKYYRKRVSSRAGMGTRPGSKTRHEDKLAVNKPYIQYYPGPYLGQACELFKTLNRAKKRIA